MCPGSRAKPTSPCSPRCSSGCSTAPSALLKPGGHAGLLRLLAGAGGGRGADRRPAGARSAHCPPADRGGGGLRPRRIRHRRRRPAHAAAASSRPRSALGRPRRFLCRAAGARLSPISTPPAGILAVPTTPSLSLRTARENRACAAGDERLNDAGFGRGASRLSVLIGRRAFRSLIGRLQRAPARCAGASRPAQDRPAGDRAAGPAHRRRHPRQRNLCRPLRFRRQGGDLRPAARRSR